MSRPRISTTKVGTVGIPVADPGRALEFYLGILGFEKRLDVPFGNGARWIEVAPPGAETTIALVPAGSGQHPGIRFVTQDADADHASLQAHGVEADTEITRAGHPVPPMFSFRDPDGNRLLIVESSQAHG
jgi:catechol 2,3-dioxygenase-like lactoylglutathione lyase family enzyme